MAYTFPGKCPLYPVYIVIPMKLVLLAPVGKLINSINIDDTFEF